MSVNSLGLKNSPGIETRLVNSKRALPVSPGSARKSAKRAHKKKQKSGIGRDGDDTADASSDSVAVAPTTDTDSINTGDDTGQPSADTDTASTTADTGDPQTDTNAIPEDSDDTEIIHPLTTDTDSETDTPVTDTDDSETAAQSTDDTPLDSETAPDTGAETDTGQTGCIPGQYLALNDGKTTVVSNKGCYRIRPENSWTNKYMVAIVAGGVSQYAPLAYSWSWTLDPSISGDGVFTELWTQTLFENATYPGEVILILKGDGNSMVEIQLYESS